MNKLKKADLIRETKYKNFIYYELNVSMFEEVMLWFGKFQKIDLNKINIVSLLFSSITIDCILCSTWNHRRLCINKNGKCYSACYDPSNSQCGGGTTILLAKTEYNTLIRPEMTGILGAIPFIIVAVILLVKVGELRVKRG